MSDPSIASTVPGKVRNRDRTSGRNTTPKPEGREEQVRATLSQVLHRTEFTTGLRYGVIAVGAGVVLAAVWRLTRRRVAPIAGLVFSAGAVLALRDAVGIPNGLLVALALLAGGTAAAEVLRVPPAVEMAIALPGAILVAREVAAPVDGWVTVVISAVIVLGGAAAGNFDHRWRRRGIGPVLAAITIAGIYVCVPETKRMMVLLGVALPLPLMGWPLALASLGRAGSYTFVGVALWAAAIDGAARPSSIIGAVASLGLLIAEPLARALADRRGPLELIPERLPAWLWVLPVAALHLGLVFIGARVAGLRATVDEAVAIVAAVAIATVCIGLGLRFWAPPSLPKITTRAEET